MEVEFKIVGELFEEYKNEKILIPIYQRGYRWRVEEVEALLSDIKAEQDGYCLQSIVFKGNAIVDGQQRLTTITLIRDELGYKDGSLLNIDDRNAIDKYFIEKNIEAIKNFFKGFSEDDKNSFYEKLNSCFFIKCTLDENENAEDVFMRLNAGKIPLSSAEILKSYYLTDKIDNSDEGNRHGFISKWLEIEKALQDDSFYFFFSHDERQNERYYSSRMDFLLEVYLLQINKGKAIDFKQLYESSPIFAFTRIYKAGISSANLIAKLREMLQKMQIVYTNTELYNLYGYLSCNQKDKDPLYLLCDIPQKEEILQKLKYDAKKSVDFSKEKLEALNYDYNKNEIKKVLLLHNAIESIQKEIRFDYNAYRNTDYELEHIHAREELKVEEDVRNFCANVLERYSKKESEELKIFLSEFKAFCDEYSSQKPNSQEQLESWDSQEQLESWEECIWVLDCNGQIKRTDDNKIKWRYVVPEGENEESFAGEWRYTSICNLCLLPASVNSSIGNGSFAKKRKHVMEKFLNGVQLPVVTREIFSVFIENEKYRTSDIAVWGKALGNSYLESINNTIREYFNE